MYDILQALWLGAQQEGFTRPEFPIKVSYVVELTKTGKILNIDDLTKLDGSQYRMAPAWYVERSGKSDATGFLIEKLAGFGFVNDVAPEKEEKKKKTKRLETNDKNRKMGQDSLKKLQACYVKTKHPGVEAVIKFLSANPQQEFIKHLGDGEAPYLSGYVLFVFDGKFVHRDHKIQRYYAETFLQKAEEGAMSMLTGKPVKHLVDPFPKCYVKGLKNSAPLFFRNTKSVEHYNVPKEYSYPMDYTEAFPLLAFFQRLFLWDCPSPKSTKATPPTLKRRSVLIPGNGVYNVAIWSPRSEGEEVVDVAQQLLSTHTSLFSADGCAGVTTEEQRIRAGLQLLGQTKDTALNDIDRAPLFVLGVCGMTGQLAVQDWHSLTIGSARQALQQHYRDSSVPTQQTGKPMLFGMRGLIRCGCASTNKKWANSVPEGLWRQMWRALLLGVDYPAMAVTRAFDRFTRELRGGAPVTSTRTVAQLSLLRGYLNRNCRYREKGKEVSGMLDLNNNNPAYLLGRLLELTDYIAYRGYKPKTGPGTQLLAVAMQNPQQAIEKATVKIGPQLEKIRRNGSIGSAVNASKEFYALLDQLDTNIPRQFSQQDRMLLSIGFGQAKIKRFNTSAEAETDK